MSGDYERYLSEHFRHISTPAIVERNAAFAVARHGRFFPANKKAAILEIGPGFGALINRLRNVLGYENVKGIDVSPEVVDACNAMLPGCATLAPDTTQYLQEHAGEFDLILMFHVLEHVPQEQINPLLMAARSALKADGRFVAEVPNVVHPITGAYHRYHDFTHTVGFMDQSLAFALRRAGFQEVTVYACKTVRTNPVRALQRLTQDTLEFLSGLLMRPYLPHQPVILTSVIGGCGKK